MMKSRIYLLGGSSHVGKTLFADKLMKETGIPYLSIDHLKMGLIRTGLTDIPVESDDRLRVFLWPIVAEMIKTAIENNQSMIVEGCYIPATWRDSFDDSYLCCIHEAFIVMSEAYIRDNITDIKAYGDVIETRLYKEVNLERLVKCSAWFKEDSKAYGNSFVEIDGVYDTEAIFARIKEALDL